MARAKESKVVEEAAVEASSEPTGIAAIEALPDAGHARREELKRRMAALEAEAAKLEAELEAQGIDPAKLSADAVEREVREATSDAGEVRVSNAQPGFAYTWIYRDPFSRFGGRQVYAMQALGWERVAGNMPEAVEHKSVTGERWVADCLLMRCPIERFMALQLLDRKKRLAQQEGISAALFERAARAGVRVTNLRDDPRLRALVGINEDKLDKRVPTSRQLRQRFAREIVRDLGQAR
jgi:hypothetical protein